MSISSPPSNGHKVVERGRMFDVLKLGDTVEEKRPIEINGRTLWAWIITNGRFPATLGGELDDARQRWLAERHPVDPAAATTARLWQAATFLADLVDGERDPPRGQEVDDGLKALTEIVRGLQANPPMRSTEVAWQAYQTEALCILIPGLEYQEAELLPAADRLNVLYELGYMERPSPASKAEADDGDDAERGGESQAPPEKGPSSTGDEPAPDSVASME